MKPKILLCGAGVTQDKKLLNLFQKQADLSLLREARQIETIIRESQIDLIVFEFSDKWEADLHSIKALKANFPQTAIVVVDDIDSREIVIRCFQIGVNDYFKKPYSPYLLAEREEALLKRKLENERETDKNSPI